MPRFASFLRGAASSRDGVSEGREVYSAKGHAEAWFQQVVRAKCGLRQFPGGRQFQIPVELHPGTLHEDFQVHRIGSVVEEQPGQGVVVAI
jgi:hypothetical protein